MKKEILNVKEVAEYLKISLPTAYQIVNQVNFPKIKIGNRYKIPMDALENWIENQGGKASDPSKR